MILNTLNDKLTYAEKLLNGNKLVFCSFYENEMMSKVNLCDKEENSKKEYCDITGILKHSMINLTISKMLFFILTIITSISVFYMTNDMLKGTDAETYHHNEAILLILHFGVFSIISIMIIYIEENLKSMAILVLSTIVYVCISDLNMGFKSALYMFYIIFNIPTLYILIGMFNIYLYLNIKNKSKYIGLRNGEKKKYLNDENYLQTKYYEFKQDIANMSNFERENLEKELEVKNKYKEKYPLILG